MSVTVLLRLTEGQRGEPNEMGQVGVDAEAPVVGVNVHINLLINIHVIIQVPETFLFRPSTFFAVSRYLS